MTARLTERHLLDALHRRHGTIGQTGVARWVVAEHVRASPGWAHRIADFMAQDTYGNSGPTEKRHPLHGFEIKVSRADLLHELRRPDKAETFSRHCHHWWLVLSDPWLIREGELPPTWGLLAFDRGRLVQKVPAPMQVPEPLPPGLQAGLLRAVQQTRQPTPPRRGVERPAL